MLNAIIEFGKHVIRELDYWIHKTS
jgi:hypothetical protein